MGVYIKGLKLPSAERQGELLILTDDGRCVDMFSGEYEAVELPPHGRLIDADALSERIEEQRNTEYAMKNRPVGTWKRVLELPLDMISDAPTIIEAEGEE